MHDIPLPGVMDSDHYIIPATCHMLTGMNIKTMWYNVYTYTK